MKVKLALVFLLILSNVAKGNKDMVQNYKFNNLDADEISDSKALVNERKLAPRIDQGISSQSYQVIQISNSNYRHGLLTDYVDRMNFNDKRLIIKQENIVKAIKAYAATVREQSSPKDKYLASKYDSKKLKTALKYFESAKEPYIFTSHYEMQYSYDEPKRTDIKNNLIITDFVGNYKDNSSWSQYLLIIKEIPLESIGSAKYSFTVNGEAMSFRTVAKKEIWSLSNKYWGYANIFSTKNGKDKAPLIILLDHPMNSYLDNGCYLVIPK